MGDTSVNSLMKLSSSELDEKLQKCEFVANLIKEEQKRRSKSSGLDIDKLTAEVDNMKVTKKIKKTKEKEKETKSTINATKDDMKHILTENKVEYKMSMNKEQLEELVRKHNLIRAAEHKKKTREEIKK